MRAHAEIFAAVLAGGAAGWYLRELWLRDAARREAEVRSGGARSKILRPRFVLTVRVLPPPPHPPVTSNRFPRSQAMVQRGIDAATPEALLAEAQIPARAGREFPVSSGDTALVLIDMQFDFLSKEGRLGGEYSDARVKQLAATEAKVAALLAAARGAGLTVAHSRSHRYGAQVRRDLAHPVVDEGYDLVPSCRPLPGEIVVDKWTFGAFASTDLERRLRERGVRRILLAGILTNVCIMATAVQAVDRFFRTCLVEDCCGAFDPRWHEHALELINGPQTLKENHHKSVGLYFGEVAKLEDVEKALAKCGKAR